MQMQSKRLEKVERVFVAVDVMNLWYSARHQFGDGVRVNYRSLIDLIKSKALGSYPREIHAIAYTVTSSTKQMTDGSIKHVDPRVRNARFARKLGQFGFEVKNRHMYTEKGTKKPFATDWDVGIAVDAMHLADTYDTFALISGDGDYALLIEKLQEQSKYVEVFTFKSAVSRLLHVSAHRIIYLSEDEIFRMGRHGEDSGQEKSQKDSS
jgi:uncharacterized LabA/DUF88 family protein